MEVREMGNGGTDGVKLAEEVLWGLIGGGGRRKRERRRGGEEAVGRGEVV